jgi:hypothetical protein
VDEVRDWRILIQADAKQDRARLNLDPAASIQKRSPNTLVTASPRTVAIVAVATVLGTMNQSFE